MQDTNFATRRRSVLNNQLTLSSHVAVTVISRALRPLLKRSRRFVAAVILDDGADHGAYRVASLRVLDNGLSHYTESIRDFDVISVDTQDDQQKLAKLPDVDRVIILLRSAEVLGENVIAASDIIVHLPRPIAKDFRIGARRMGFGRLSLADAEFLETQDPGKVSLAFRPGRTTDAIMNTLRSLPSREEKTVPDSVKAGPTLEHLSGYGAAKTWGLELAHDLVEWKAGRLDWRDVDRGVLLFGPPGSGKTQFASALARTCGIELVATSAAQWQSAGHLGDMLKAMRGSFASAKKNPPSILFIDELDSVGTRSTSNTDSATYERQVVNALLESIDGTQGLEGVLVIGATNFPQVIDPALLRPGRLERHFEIELPDAAARLGIFRYHLANDLVSSDVEAVVRDTDGLSGADIAKLVRDARRVARRRKRDLEVNDLVACLPEKVSIPPEYREMTAVHEAGHAIVGVLVEADELVSVSIAESINNDAAIQSVGGAAFREKLFGRKTSTYFDDRIAVLLAGMAAERVMFKEHSAGSGGHQQSDLIRATELATMMEVKWGFGASISSQVSNSSAELDRLRETKPRLGQAVEARLKTQYARAENMLIDRADVLREIASVLMESKTMTGADVLGLVAKHGAKNKDLAATEEDRRL